VSGRRADALLEQGDKQSSELKDGLEGGTSEVKGSLGLQARRAGVLGSSGKEKMGTSQG
jgi:hypothetical protein